MSWKDAELGKFEWDGMAWLRTMPMPAFKAFSYNKSKGKYELAFNFDDGEDEDGNPPEPTEQMVALAKTVLAHQEKLVNVVAQSLWDNFQGVGPRTGMYWEGDINELLPGLEDEMGEDDAQLPTGPKDVLKLLELSSVSILPKISGYKGPIASINLHAAFEGEHGVSVLTDGTTILGIGYMSDATLFKKPLKKKK